MKTGVNLVAILLTLSCVLPALETKSSQESRRLEQKKYTSSSNAANKKVLRINVSKLPQQNAIMLHGSTHAKRPKVRTKQQKGNNTALVKSTQLQRERPRRRKHKMDRMMMALLMAYKMKFIALVPTLVGGLILLTSTALLAGFFFALFAAVLGLKAH